MTKKQIIELCLPNDRVLVSSGYAVLITICETDDTFRPLATCLRQNNDFWKYRIRKHLFYGL